MFTNPWGKRLRTVFEIPPEMKGKLSAIPSIRMFPETPSALPGAGQLPVEFIIASTAEDEEILGFA